MLRKGTLFITLTSKPPPTLGWEWRQLPASHSHPGLSSRY
nr:MAG TPA_asm: GMP synthase [Caudoviricetes sp.]